MQDVKFCIAKNGGLKVEFCRMMLNLQDWPLKEKSKEGAALFRVVKRVGSVCFFGTGLFRGEEGSTLRYISPAS